METAMTMHVPLPATAILTRISGFAREAVLRLGDLARAYKNRRDMQLLASLDDRMLRDIGLTRADIRDAAAEPVWRDPTAVLVTRARERRMHRRWFWPKPRPSDPVKAPPIAPDIDEWSARFFPARSRYY
jgi:uncharacterized protein YjiS (DUF1127 family)